MRRRAVDTPPARVWVARTYRSREPGVFARTLASCASELKLMLKTIIENLSGVSDVVHSPAVDREDLRSKEAGFVGYDKRDGMGNIFGLADAPHHRS